MCSDKTYLCRCEEITVETVEQAIADGFVTMNEIKRLTRAGTGICQGRTCGRMAAALIARKTGQSLEEILPSSRRPPVRPVGMGIIRDGQQDESSGGGGEAS